MSKAGVSKTPELLRVINLPRRKFDVNSYPDASILYSKARCSKPTCQYCKDGSPSLRPIQNAMLVEAAQNSGLFANAGVGTGKTLASFLMHDALQATRTVLLVPPQLRDKTLYVDLPELKQHFKIPEVYSAEEYHPGLSGVFVIAYSELSQTTASDLLDKIQPDLVVADEAHNLRHKKSARTRRFLRFMRANPSKFVAMTGSAIFKSIKDFAHLIEICLGKNSPVPADYPTLTAMADAIDNEGKEGATGIGALALMCDDTESAREGFQRRFSETPGVIITTESSAGMALEIKQLHVIPPAIITSSLQKLEQEWSWDGEDYDGALDISRLQRHITQGFFYRSIWPHGIVDREYLEKRNAWKRTIRLRLSHSNRQGQDSPALLEAMAEAGAWTPEEWLDWLTVRDRPEPDKEAIEVDQYLVNLAESWGQESPGIIWVNSPVIGKWLNQRGITYYGEGDKAGEALNAYAKACLDGLDQIKTIACSIFAHGTGKNLQAWNRNLVLYPPSMGEVWEQLIGRTHRPGQVADVVTLDIILASVGAINSLAIAREDAERAGQETGQVRRLSLATWL